MARPLIVSFDCAGTLLHTDYTPEGFAVRTAEHLGFTPTESDRARYVRLFRAGLPQYVALNMKEDEAALETYWRELTREWIQGTPMEGNERALTDAAKEILYSPEHRYFSMYEDVLPTLERLQAEGWRMIILSNWDLTLAKVLASAKLEGFFERIFASLVFGVEKPDPAFFRYAQRELSATPDRFVHIGDRTDDDLEGAQNVGWKGFLIDRSLSSSQGDRLASLTELPDRLLQLAEEAVPSLT